MGGQSYRTPTMAAGAPDSGEDGSWMGTNWAWLVLAIIAFILLVAVALFVRSRFHGAAVAEKLSHVAKETTPGSYVPGFSIPTAVADGNDRAPVAIEECSGSSFNSTGNNSCVGSSSVE